MSEPWLVVDEDFTALSVDGEDELTNITGSNVGTPKIDDEEEDIIDQENCSSSWSNVTSNNVSRSSSHRASPALSLSSVPDSPTSNSANGSVVSGTIGSTAASTEFVELPSSRSRSRSNSGNFAQVQELLIQQQQQRRVRDTNLLQRRQQESIEASILAMYGGSNNNNNSRGGGSNGARLTSTQRNNFISTSRISRGSASGSMGGSGGRNSINLSRAADGSSISNRSSTSTSTSSSVRINQAAAAAAAGSIARHTSSSRNLLRNSIGTSRGGGSGSGGGGSTGLPAQRQHQ
mmetsp:Transcript_12258/g.20345  ORF Transcript_12258/g.20345 Transcript_12258/m.20345 type:complete len:291 (-) Transcript_12258:536-1408(-)